MYESGEEEYPPSYPPTPIKSIDKNIFRVTRGQLCYRKEQWTEIRKICDGSDLEELKRFVTNLKDCEDYTGILHTNTFRVNQPIGLVGLGFFGPFENESARYDVLIEIEELRSKIPLYSTSISRIFAERKKKFDVQFNSPVIIQPNVFYNVRFQLDGPKTGICDPNSLLRECYGHSSDDTQIQFEFLGGSLQMPDVIYTPL